jgi:hypothetical protein
MYFCVVPRRRDVLPRVVTQFPSREREFDSRRQLNVRFKFGPGKLVNGG